jgi:methionyl-tRNA formyltransferase
MKIVFAGTPPFSVPCLQAAAERGEVVAVYTQPDRTAGRGRELLSTPVKNEALKRGLPVRQPESLRTRAARAELRALEPDLMVVVAYGLILPRSVLEIPRYGCWNVHASLLPRWRGAAPIQRAIEAGDSETGISLMQMDAGLDTGPVLLSQSLPIGAEDTAGQVHMRLATLGAQVLADGLGLLRAGLLPQPRPQPEAGVTYAHKLEKAEARLDWRQSAKVLEHKVRAFHPWPIAEADLAGERVRIHAASALPSSHDAVPGSVLATGREGIDVACGEGALRIRSLQRAGGRPISAADYLNARQGLVPQVSHLRAV